MLVVVFVESVPDHLRGYLDRYLNEVQSSVFVGSLSRVVADQLWAVVSLEAGAGHALMVRPDSNESGMRIEQRISGSWRIVDRGGWELPSRRKAVRDEID